MPALSRNANASSNRITSMLSFPPRAPTLMAVLIAARLARAESVAGERTIQVMTALTGSVTLFGPSPNDSTCIPTARIIVRLTMVALSRVVERW